MRRIRTWAEVCGLLLLMAVGWLVFVTLAFVALCIGAVVAIPAAVLVLLLRVMQWAVDGSGGSVKPARRSHAPHPRRTWRDRAAERWNR